MMMSLVNQIIGEDGASVEMTPEAFFREWGRKGASSVIRRMISIVRDSEGELAEIADGLADDLEKMGHSVIPPSTPRDNDE